MRPEDYYESVVSKWEEQYPSTGSMQGVWDFYIESGYLDPEASLIQLFEGVHWSKKRLLDLGCDTGFMLNFLCESFPGIEGYGVDINRSSIGKAKSLFPKHKFETFDGVALPFPDRYFDVVFVSAVVKHIRYEDRQQFYQEITRVSDSVVFIEVDSKQQKTESKQNWVFYLSHFEEEFRSNFKEISVTHEGGDILGYYRTNPY